MASAEPQGKGQVLASPPDATRSVHPLFESEDWNGLLNAIPESGATSPDLCFYRGMALAHLERREEARLSFQKGLKKAPSDKRFYLELAGLSFQVRDLRTAKGHLRKALQLDPQDRYALEFLATIYSLKDNLEGALKYWNLAGKPRIETLTSEPRPRVKPDLLDRAMVFAPASKLSLEDYRATESRLKQLEIFSFFRFDLVAQEDEKFDLVFRPQEKNGLGDGPLPSLFNIFRGIFLQKVHLDYFNIQRAALNAQSSYRWDAQRRRLTAALSGTWQDNPRWRYRFQWQDRRELWNISNSYRAATPLVGDLRFEKHTSSAEIHSVENGRWAWWSGVKVSRRQFGNLPPESGNGPRLFADGWGLKHQVGLQHLLLDLPEHRTKTETSFSWETAKLLAQGNPLYGRAQAGLRTQWFPRAEGEDYAMTARVRLGTLAGSAPFDDFFFLGIEQDSDLWLRAHRGARRGKRGHGPLGRDFFLVNWELDKILYQKSLLRFFVGPFVDSGRAFDQPDRFGSPHWHWDVGAQFKIRSSLLPTLVFGYAKDLQTGSSALVFGMRP